MANFETFASIPSVPAHFNVPDLIRQLRINDDLYVVEAAFEDLLVTQIAHAMGLRVTLQEIEEEENILRIRLQLKTPANFKAWLSDRGLKISQVRERLGQIVLKDKLIKKVTGDRVGEFFEAHHRDYDLFEVSQLVVSQLSEAETLRKRLEEGGDDFSALAFENSIDPDTSSRGGVLSVCRAFALPEELKVEISGSDSSEALVGPYAIAKCFVLFRAVRTASAVLDPPTAREIGDRIFGDWLKQQRIQHGFDNQVKSLLGEESLQTSTILSDISEADAIAVLPPGTVGIADPNNRRMADLERLITRCPKYDEDRNPIGDRLQDRYVGWDPRKASDVPPTVPQPKPPPPPRPPRPPSPVAGVRG